MKSITMVVLAVIATSSLVASEQTKSVVMMRGPAPRELTGNLRVDLFGQKELAGSPLQNQTEPLSEVHGKSPWLAAGLSIVVPGAGEAYAGNYWKAALFLAVDIAAWGLAYHFDNKGNTQTDFFQGYADQHWDPVRYALYSRDHVLPADQRSRYPDANLINPNRSLPSWERVNWGLLNQMEREISATVEGKYYSHTLPLRPEQQYYELIGKYPQFNQGWDDAPTAWTYSETNLTVHFKYYSIERGKANDYYASATTFVTVAIVNHVLSALDAAWTASSYNHNLHASIRMQPVPTGYGFTQVPVARVEYSF